MICALHKALQLIECLRICRPDKAFVFAASGATNDHVISHFAGWKPASH